MRKIIVSLLMFFSIFSVTTLSFAAPDDYARGVVAANPDKLELWIKNGGTEQSLINEVMTNFNNINAIDWDGIYKDVYGHYPWEQPKPGDNLKNPSSDNNNEGLFGFLDVTYILENLQKQIPALTRLIVAIGYISGLVFFVMAIMRLKAYGHQTVASAYHTSVGPSFAYVLAGCALMYFPSMMNVGTASLLGPGNGDSVLGYGEFNSLPYAQLFVTVIMIVRLVGYIAFLRGWLMLSKVGGSHGQQGGMTKGIVHVVGGILAVNIVTTWEILRATLGYVW